MNINPYGLEIKSNNLTVAPHMFGTLIQLTSEYRISWKHQIVQETGLTTSYTNQNSVVGPLQKIKNNRNRLITNFSIRITHSIKFLNNFGTTEMNRYDAIN